MDFFFTKQYRECPSFNYMVDGNGGHSKSEFNKLWLVWGKKGFQHTYRPPQNNLAY